MAINAQHFFCPHGRNSNFQQNDHTKFCSLKISKEFVYKIFCLKFFNFSSKFYETFFQTPHTLSTNVQMKYSGHMKVWSIPTKRSVQIWICQRTFTHDAQKKNMKISDPSTHTKKMLEMKYIFLVFFFCWRGVYRRSNGS